MLPTSPPSSDLASQSWYGEVGSGPRTEVPEFPPGHSIGLGRFTIKKTVGKGAMGRVYAVEDHERGRTVALKTLQLHSPEAAHALKLEFRALRDVTHPNLVRLHELFVEANDVFFTMDLLEGVPFDQCDRALLRPLLAQLVAAVQALHATGKLHRDLKPANVLVDAAGRLVVLDFGLVHDSFREAAPSRAESSSLIGTPRYMSPELLGWGRASESSDWYAVGVMLYETLTGRLPDEGGLARLMRGTRPEPPSVHVPDIEPALDAVCQALLDPDPANRADGGDLLAALGVDSVRGPHSVPPRTTELVGRSVQLTQLEDCFRRFQQTREPAAILLSGLSGMGKTVLAEEFLRRHADGARVYSGQCHEQEAVSHKAFDEIVDALVLDLLGDYADRVLELVDPSEAQHLVRLFPALRRIPALSSVPEDEAQADPRALRKRAYDALRSVLSRLAHERPLILCIDDLQWGDLDSARLLYELFAGSGRPSCLLLLSFRSDEAERSECLERLLRGSRCLADVMDVQRVSVEELGERDAEELARSLLSVADGSDDPRVAALCREARGSPLLLRELALHLELEPDAKDRAIGLLDIVRARLERLGESARRLFALTCVAAVPIREALLRRASGLGAVDSAIIELETERLLRPRASESADAVEVVHDGIRGAALSDLSPELLRTLHEDLARAHSVEPEPDVEALCRHYAGAKLKAESAYWAQKAAAVAKASFAFDHAAMLYRRALALVDADDPIGPHLRLQLANALADAGHGAEAAPLFLHVAERATPEEALEYRRRAAEQLLFTGRIEEGLDVLQQVYAGLGMSLPRGNVAAMTAVAADRLKLRWRGTDLSERQVSEIAPLVLLRLDACRAGWMLSYVSPLQGAALQSRYLRLALDAGEPRRVGMGLGIEALQHSIEGDNPGRFALQERAREIAERIGTPQAIGFQCVVDANCAYLAGEWEQCSRYAEQAERWLTRRCRGSTWELNTLRFFWALSLYYQGRFRELRRRSDAWLADAEERGDLCALAGLRLNAARSYHLADDDPAKAQAELEQGLREWSLADLGVHRFLAEISRVQIQLYDGQVEDALATVRRLGPEFRTSSMRRVKLCRVLYHYHCAFVALALAASDASKRKRRLRRAKKHQKKLQAEGTSWGNALARYIAAERQLLEGDDEKGLATLRAAVSELDECDMYSVAAGARFRLGQYLGDAEGESLVTEARSFMRAQGVVNPDRLLGALAPGRAATPRQ